MSSLAFVVAAVAVLRRYRSRRHFRYGLLVAAVGLGSLVQHGPHPAWQAYAHDLPLAGVLAFLAADAAADLAGRRPRAWWWLLPAAAVAPLVAAGPAASTVGQAVLAAAAIGLNLARAWRRPRLRRVLLGSLLLLGAGAALGTVGDRTALCQPESLWQGHAVWHALAAVALWRMAPAVGSGPAQTPTAVTGDLAGTAEDATAAARPAE